jgi:hypothetical protein
MPSHSLQVQTVILKTTVIFCSLIYSYQANCASTCSDLLGLNPRVQALKFNGVFDSRISFAPSQRQPIETLYVYGLSVSVFDAPENPGPAMSIWLGHPPTPAILINFNVFRQLNIIQQEFAVYHEIGHLIFRHSSQVPDWIAQRDEYDADAFAAAHILKSRGKGVFPPILKLLNNLAPIGNQHPPGALRAARVQRFLDTH